MSDAAYYAANLTERGYSCYPLNVSLDSNGDKSLSFKDGLWAAGEYPTDPEEIREHWEGFSGLMVNTGRSGLVVVDIDVSKGKAGFDNLQSAGVKLPDTPVKVETPTGGQHWYYREPAGYQVPSDNTGKLAKDVDVRARGALVIAPPTEIPGRGAYRFGKSMVPASELPEFPPELAEALRPREAVRRTLTERPLLTVEQRQQMLSRFDTLLRELHKMEPGQRNGTLRLHMNRLYGIAMSLGENLDNVDELVREAYYNSGGSDDQQIETFIEWSRERAEFEAPPDPINDEEFEAEVQQGVRREKVRAAVRERLQPVQLSKPSPDDVLSFDPEAAKARWWVRDFLPRGVTGILFAPRNTGKSFMAIDLACGVATGTEAWATPVPRSKVLYLAGEGHAGLPVRKRAWEIRHGREASDVELRKMRLVLSNEDSVAEHVKLVRESGASLIIVDTFLRAMQGFTLENPNEASLGVARLDMIREAAGEDATLLVLHHPSKSNPNVPAGSYPIESNVDTILPLNEDPDTGYLKLRVEKARDADKSRSLLFQRRTVDIPDAGLQSLVLEEARYPYATPAA